MVRQQYLQGIVPTVTSYAFIEVLYGLKHTKIVTFVISFQNGSQTFGQIREWFQLIDNLIVPRYETVVGLNIGYIKKLYYNILGFNFLCCGSFHDETMPQSFNT